MYFFQSVSTHSSDGLVCSSSVHLNSVSDDLCQGVTCAVSGEVCQSGECKCGNGASCENRATGSHCDASSSTCKCGPNIESCQDGVSCINGVCGNGKNLPQNTDLL